MPPEGRVLVVTESFGVGGTESHLVRLLPRLASRGWKIAAFCLSERGRRAAEVEAGGVEVFCAKRKPIHMKRPLRYPLEAVRAFCSLHALMREWQPSITHFYLPGPYLLGAPAAFLARVPIRIMSRRSLRRYQLNRPMTGALERLLHKGMDMLVGNSRAVVNELLTEGVPKNKVRLIYNGINLPKNVSGRKVARRELGLDPDSLVGVVIANLIAYKGHKELLVALGQVAQRLPPRWCVLLAGRDQGLRAELEHIAQQQDITSRVRFLGERLDVPTLLAASDFGMLTSLEEGFSNAVLEMMAAGLPLIVTDVGGNSEAVLHEHTGLVVPPNDPSEIGKAVLRIARDADLRQRFGAAARNRASEEFSMARCVASHAALYEELLDKCRKGA